MGVDIHVGDLWLPNATQFNVTEDSTPIDPGDTSGGYGQANFTVPEQEGDKALIDKNFTLVDKAQGTTQAIVRSISSDKKLVTLTADSRMSLMAVTRTAQVFSGTLEGALRYYLGLVDLNDGIVVDPTIASQHVDLPGWSAEVGYQIMKKMAPKFGFEVSLVSNNIVFRRLRGRVATNYRDSSQGWSIDRSQMARTVEGYAYHGVLTDTGLVYPAGGWNADVQIYQVDANELLEFDIPIEGSLTAISQPAPVNTVLRDDNDASVYSISGGDGLPYPASQWRANGGSLITTIGEDTRSIHVRLQGPNDLEHQPYRIAAGESASDYFSTLRILGSGVIFDKEKISIQTGVDPERATQEVGVTIDNEFINTREELLDAMIWSVAAWTGPRRAYTAATKGINRIGDSGSYAYPTIAQFNALWAGSTIADFNAAFAGQTIRQFNQYELATVSSDFSNQAFGNIAGARVYDDYAWNRIRTAAIGASGVSYTAEADTTLGDFNDVWAGQTIADFNAAWYKKTILEFNVQPLKHPKRVYDPTTGGYGSGTYGHDGYGTF